MTTFYLPTQALPTKTVSFFGLEKYPAKRQERFFQKRMLTPGGAPISNNIGLTKRYIDINIKNMIDDEWQEFQDFMEGSALWSINPFEFLDADGVLWENCHFWFDAYVYTRQQTVTRHDSLITIISSGEA